MNYSLGLNHPLRSSVLDIENSIIKKALYVLSGVFLLAIASQLSIPLAPIPLTFQSTTVILIGMVYGPRYGTYVILAYLFAGIAGIPVFADYSVGISKFWGPTGGYLLGFFPAVVLSGYLTQKGWGRNFVSSFVTGLLGTSVIFFFGVWMLAKYIGWHNAVAFGLLPFIISEPMKLIAAALIIPRLWKEK